ncbi:DUF2797 domain-containing protein [Halapricum salinum]|uniref:DUF2797 domain-containing protein n=1 Tax=Halapricum salinum TaxID=1457250 RepID=A0A4D6HEU9_9EURY|nr:DUF2797 domain-containing protein [Halapricum salinum]QCC51247.1 DUF2797 domain-containing protein [Halapricum salinum]
MQIVGYDTGVPDGGPALVLASDGTLQREPLTPGTDLALTLGERHCAGTIDYSGASERTAAPDGARHLACDRSTAPYCDQHTDRWPCARCTGNCDLPLESCREDHAIYLAAFAPATFKVGVTRSWRLDTRLREQGADRAAHLRTVADGRVARQIEAEIATDIGDRVRVPTKIDGIHEPVDESAWSDLLADFDPIDTFEFEYGFDLAERPVAETLATGSVRGTQGRVLVLERNGSTYAVNMRDLVGYEVSREASSRQLQSSLGAFQ